jgi:hypothetical protein
MNRKTLGLSVAGLLAFAGPGLAEETKAKTEYKKEQDTGKNGSKVKEEKSTKTGDVIKTTKDEEKVEASTKKNAKGGTDTEVTKTSKHPRAGSKKTVTAKTKEKVETDASGNVVKEEKEKK